MNVTNMSWNHSKLNYDSQINNSKCQLQSLCIPTLSQPLMGKQIQTHHTVLFAYVSYPTIQTQLQVFHTPHENESYLHPFMDYLIQLQESLKRHLLYEIPLEVTQKVDIDYWSISRCPFCPKKLESNKVKHLAHMVGEYSNGVEVKHYEAGQYICTCCKNCNLQLLFNKKNYRLPV